MKPKKIASVFLSMVMITVNVNVVFPVESVESESKAKYSDEALSDSAINVNLTESSDSVVSADLADTCGDNLTWSVDNYMLTISGTGSMYDYSRTSRPPWSGNSVYFVTIEDGVTSIGDYAFYYNTNLFTVRMADSVTSIGDYACYSCIELYDITISKNIKNIGAAAFANCSRLTDITIPGGSISDYAFQNCDSLSNITLSEGVESIGTYVFYETGLSDITIPSSVTNIDGGAFFYSKFLINITVEADNAYYTSENGILFNKELTKLICYPPNRDGTSYTIPDGVKEIDAYAFGCSMLENIEIPNTVEIIGDFVFNSCTAIEKIIIPDSVTSMGYSTFYRCRSLTDITLSKNVKILDAAAFCICTALVNITIPDGITNINTQCFYGCTGLENVTIPSSVTEISEDAFQECDTEKLILCVYADSYALYYAKENGYNYKIISDEETKKFEMLKDNYGFKNEPDSFGYSDKQEMSFDVFKELYGEPLGETMYNNNKTWPGSCFGMAATCLGFFEYNSDRTLYTETFGLDSSTETYPYTENLYGVPAPSSSSSLNVLTHFIEIFLISQYSSSMKSIYNKKNISASDNNWKAVDSMVNAIYNFAETGEDPIVIIVYKPGNAHAVVPFNIEENSEGNYIVSLYDNNMPDETTYLTIYKDDNGITGYYYNGNSDGTDDSVHIYTDIISYVYEEDIYNYVADALSANSVKLMENDSSDELAQIFVNSDDVVITNSSGVSIDDIEESFEMITIGTPSETKGYCVPYGEYIIKNKDSSLESFELSAATSVDAKTIVTDDNTAAVTVGIYDTGYTYISATASSKSNMEITTVNSSGQKQVVEADCTYLSVDTEGLYETYVKSSESSAYVNGVSTKVSSSTGTSISTQDVSSGIITDIGSVILPDEEYYFAESGNTDLSCTDGKITGNICLNLYNKSGSSFSAVIVAAIYDSEGKFVCSENKSIVVGNDSNYISLKNLSIDVNENEDYSCRVFLWKDMLSMRPITAPVDIEIS
ncbi:MAG: leucine-rich repeat domain-containing protein [Clostridiales bacterium]|nr:leucine-rich repeat domain-containing protein [Clostridiales bacterium]